MRNGTKTKSMLRSFELTFHDSLVCLYLFTKIVSSFDTYLTTTLILSSGVDGALSDDRSAIFSSDSASLLRLKERREKPNLIKSCFECG